MGAKQSTSAERLGRVCKQLTDEVELKNRVVDMLCSTCENYSAQIRELHKQLRAKTVLPPQT